jgi:hypothetical protein
MKKTLFIISVLTLCSLVVSAQTKKDGTPDMRYKANKQSNSKTSYSAPKTEWNYNNGGRYKVQNGYKKSNGTYVAPNIKTTPDNKKYNNAKPKN